MLKIRIIGVVLVRAGIVVQSISFQRFLPVGKPEIAINYLDRWGVDEIVVLHIDVTADNFLPSSEQIKSYARQCQVPLSVGGGIAHISDIKKIIRAGADKVIINSSLLTAPEIVTEGCELFGQQSIVASIDSCRQNDGTYATFIHSGKKKTSFTAQQLAIQAANLGVGELFINSIDQDGKKQGYDFGLIKSIVGEVKIPVIACGGAGHPKDVRKAIHAGASAVAVGNLFHFTEHSVTIMKQYLKLHAEPIRLDSSVTYQDFNFDDNGRIKKRSDEALDVLRFQYIPEEQI